MKNAKERTAIFEEISGSGQFKEEYNRLKAEMNENEVQQLSCFLKKKSQYIFIIDIISELYKALLTKCTKWLIEVYSCGTYICIYI